MEPPKPSLLNTAKVAAVVFTMVAAMNIAMTFLLTGSINWTIVLLSATLLSVFFALLWKWKIGQLALIKKTLRKPI